AAPLIAPYDPLSIDVSNGLAAPSWTHLLGTDHLGRDVLSRLLFGARASLGAAGAVVVIVTTIGVAVATVAGFCGGWVDESIMRLVDTVLAFPSIILALVVAGLLGPGLRNVVLGMTMVRWAGYARVVRSLILSLREREFILAARSIGASDGRIMTRHLLPNILGPVVVLTTLDLGNAILGISGLSFIGLGVQLPHPEWGAMLNYGRLYIQTAPWLVVFPGLAIALSVLSANLMGDALRDLLDPRYRRYLSRT
ncbi:MAG: nickel transporter permease, partial [Chloroflexota bacterium]|nr:nickel transporter permease [Chloroflexota bacterium]